VGGILRAIDPHILAAHIAAQPHHVAFVGRDDHQFVLPEETGDCGISLVTLLAGFDGKRQPGTARKSEADNQMGDCLTGPI
jgi:hypothetical protein